MKKNKNVLQRPIAVVPCYIDATCSYIFCMSGYVIEFQRGFGFLQKHRSASAPCHLQGHWGVPEDERSNLSTDSGLSRGLFPKGRVYPQRCPAKILVRCLNHLISLFSVWSSSVLGPSRMSELPNISLSESHSNLCRLHPQSHSFGQIYIEREILTQSDIVVYHRLLL